MLLQTNASKYSQLESDFMLCGTHVPPKHWYIINKQHQMTCCRMADKLHQYHNT